MLIKICGLSTPQTITAAANAGATHIGLVHFARSPRHVTLDAAAKLRDAAPQGLKTVLLMVDPGADLARRAADIVRPDIIQFHGKETPEAIADICDQTGISAWKAMAVRGMQSLMDARRYASVCERLLFDAPAPDDASALPGGNGARFDWSLLKDHDHRAPWGLAGGLTPDNVAEAIRATGAPLVDVSSGVESASVGASGVKDVDMIAAFCKAALNV